jgi:hypothetical protein
MTRAIVVFDILRGVIFGIGLYIVFAAALGTDTSVLEFRYIGY